MCIIVAKPQGIKLPKDKYLKQCETSNPHGIGVALWKYGSNEVSIKKDFKSARFLIRWIKNNVKTKDALLVHYRYATSGLRDSGNRHPFPITKNIKLLRKRNLICKNAVVHNGVLPEFSGHKKYSDTQKFVLNILSDDAVKNNLNNSSIKKLLSKFLDGDKLAILTEKGKIILFGEFYMDKKILYSNESYKIFKKRNIKVELCRENNFPNWAALNNDIRYDQFLNEKLPCEGCGKFDFLKIAFFNGEDVCLCDECYKSYKETSENKLNNSIRMCEGCRELFEESHLMYNQFEGAWYCHGCYSSARKFGLVSDNGKEK